ncbi:MAG: cardiolipin synthase [Treponema sp.]|nr:cardiolipin synthase [Treponema sp.]
MKRRARIFKKLLYSRMIFSFLLLLVQFLIYFFFIIKYTPFFLYFAGASITLSFCFLVYLANCDGKNEFKIAWLIPTMILPIFGISLYIYTKINTGNSLIRKRIAASKSQAHAFLPCQCWQNISSSFPEIADLASYIYESDCFPAYTDSSAEYFSCGELFLPDFLSELKKARQFIFLEFFIINPDESWQLILEVLRQKVNEGVEVRVLYDGIGSVFTSTSMYRDYLNNLGIKARIYMPLFPVFNLQQNNRDHRKIAVIDGMVAYTGGMNISNEYFNIGTNKFPYWKDSAVKIRGNAVKTFTSLFLRIWNVIGKSKENLAAYFPEPQFTPEKNEGIIIPYGDNAYNEKDIAEDICLYILGKAKKYVYITTPYIVIDNQLKSALIFAARRGIDVSLIVPSKPDHFLTFCIGKTFLKTLVENGVHVYLYLPGFLHSKLFISDESIATVGSVNLDYRSFYHHFECGAVLYKNPEIEKIRRDFERIRLSCHEMQAEDYKKIPFFIRFLGRIFRVFAPLL